jgi:hypothetical protein
VGAREGVDVPMGKGTDESRYVRVYYSILEDPKFTGVFCDDAALGLWLRLLLNADASWPAPAMLPRRCSEESLKALTDAGIIDLLPNDLYRVHGLDAERGRRSAAGRAGAAALHSQRASQSDRSATAERPQSDRRATAVRPQSDRSAEPVPSKAEQEQEHKQSKSTNARARAREMRDWPPTEDASLPTKEALDWLAVRSIYVNPNGSGLHQILARLCSEVGCPKVIATFEGMGRMNTANQYILGADRVLNPIPGGGSRKEATGMSSIDEIVQAGETV